MIVNLVIIFATLSSAVVILCNDDDQNKSGRTINLEKMLVVQFLNLKKSF